MLVRRSLATDRPRGLGSTTKLLEEARERGGDMLQLNATGVENESELPFATLHELLNPLVALLPRIPPGQARAVAAALSLEDGVPDLLAVAFAVPAKGRWRGAPTHDSVTARTSGRSTAEQASFVMPRAGSSRTS